MSNTTQREVLSHEEIVFFMKHYEFLTDFNLKMNIISARMPLINKQIEDNYQLVNLLSTKSKPVTDSLFNDRILTFLSKISLGIKEKLESVEDVFFEIATYLLKDTLDKMPAILNNINQVGTISDEFLVRLEKLDTADNQNLVYIKNETTALFKALGTLLKNFFSYSSYMVSSVIGTMDNVISNISKLRQLDTYELDQYIRLKQDLSKIQQELQCFKVKSSGMTDYAQVLEEELNQLRKDFIAKMTPIYQQYNLEFLLDNEIFS